MAMEDLILVDFEMKGKDGKVYDSTKGEVAKALYGVEGPLLMLVKEFALEAVRKAVDEMKEGEEKTLELPVEKAYGKRNPKLIRTLSIKLFDKPPRPGEIYAMTTQDNVVLSGVVKSVSSGRVVIDFNHPLAGLSFTYWVKVHKRAKTLEEKVKMINEYFKQHVKDWKDVQIKDGNIEVSKELPDGIKNRIRELLGEVKVVEV